MDSEPAGKLYLLDANVLIRAHEDYYPIDRIRPFWDWLLEEAKSERVKMPLEIYNEINPPEENSLSAWIKDREVSSTLILNEEIDPEIFNRVLRAGYASNLTDDELVQIGRDPFIAAYALMGPDRAVVTKEVSRPKRTRANKTLPDVCDMMNVPWMDDFQFYRERNFRIS